jgi:hypothetical protein
LVEEALVTVEFEGGMVWLRVAAADTVSPSKLRGSGPLVKDRIPVTL